MHVVDITTAANYFGRITGITRSEMMIARALAAGETPVRFVFWSNDKARFETYDGPLDYETVCRTRLGLDYSRHVEPVPEIPEALRAPAASSMIVTGSGWLQNTTYTLGALEHAATAGLPVLFYVHDLIPTLFPYYYDDAYVSVFERNLELIARNADVLACNSRNTRDDLLAWCETRAIDPPRTALCYLGDDIGEASDEDAPLPPGLGQRDIVLAVGAVHRRKNYELLVAVWRRLAARMGGRCPDLVIVGGVTPDGRTLAREIALDPVLKARVHILRDIDNATLDSLYRAARLVAYPSHYEGWGLPVAEALARGRICLASTTPAIGEIADLGADALDPDDVPGWTSRILYYLQNAQARTAREAQLREIYRPRGWDETARAIADALDGVAPRPAPELFDGEEIDLSGPRGQAFLRARSHGPADAGAGGVRWFSDRVVRLAFRVPETNRSAARVLRLAGLRKRSRRPLTVRLNGHVIAQRRVPEACDLELDVPAGLLAADSVLEIEGDTPWRCRTGATTGAGPGPGNMPISGCAPWRC